MTQVRPTDLVALSLKTYENILEYRHQRLCVQLYVVRAWSSFTKNYVVHFSAMPTACDYNCSWFIDGFKFPTLYLRKKSRKDKTLFINQIFCSVKFSRAVAHENIWLIRMFL